MLSKKLFSEFKALVKFADVFGQLNPYQQQKAIRLVIYEIIAGSSSVRMAIFGDWMKFVDNRPKRKAGEPRFSQPSHWLPTANKIRTFFLQNPAYFEGFIGKVAA